ncbi:sterol desaturase family protein [Xanthocytophaga agilis]|uniref:Sterol desaturase family protein n=1 Tax=Xanthocytophaga agilis TaxID=3048010 RepID=A0AAE3R968_9BACT|nr:sterol desaturase family protein [Xanthocytophaga agilis]MDJ1505565.1 sterol desaturase family protein [Xanthocytophaga agilis]
METVVAFFEHIPSSYRAAILIGGILLFWSIEGIIPLSLTPYHKWRHAGLNLFFTLTTVVINFLFAALLLKTSDWTADQHFGLLYLTTMPLWLFILLGLLLLDLIGAYLIHWLEHKLKWLWKFHLIHHTDTYVDTTTANRHHPGESVFRAIFTILAVFISGAPIWLVMLYQSLSVIFSQFNHANIKLPVQLDKVISWIIVSPNMHKVHHHYKQPLTDTNYGNIFSLWDRLFGTFATENPANLIYGVDTHMDAKENNQLTNLLQIPFQPYRRSADISYSGTHKADSVTKDQPSVG